MLLRSHIVLGLSLCEYLMFLPDEESSAEANSFNTNIVTAVALITDFTKWQLPLIPKCRQKQARATASHQSTDG